jgi:hypothetical protein
VAKGHHRQGFWMVHSIHLPKDVLRKVYQLNAEKVLGLASTAKKKKRQKQVENVNEAIKAGRFAEANRLLAGVRSAAAGDWSMTNTVAKLEATIHAYQGRYEKAAETIIARLPAAAARRADDWTEWIFHHNLVLYAVARGDLVNALLALRQARLAAEQGSWTYPGRSRMMQVRLGDAWLRALFLRLRAEQLKGSARAAALHYANDARAEYRRLAKEDGGHLDSIAVLDVIFAVHDKDKGEALEAARRVSYKKNNDIEDLYLTWVGFDYGGDAAMAKAVHERMKRIDYVYAGIPVRMRWVEYDKAAKRGRPRWTPRHPNGR